MSGLLVVLYLCLFHGALAAMQTGCQCGGLFWFSNGVHDGYKANTEFQTLYCSTLSTYSATDRCGGSTTPPNGGGTGQRYNPSDLQRGNVGYCIKNNQLTNATLSNIQTGILNNVDTAYVNITGVRQWCYESTTTPTTSQRQTCANNQANAQLSFLKSSTSNCQYPTNDNFVPTGCDCSFDCTNGYVKCGTTNCIDPSTQICASGVPQSRSARRRSLGLCPVGLTSCPVAGGGRECLDIRSGLESCGGCPDSGGLDCSDFMEGAMDVACVAGKCRSSACSNGYELVKGLCIRRTSARAVHLRIVNP